MLWTLIRPNMDPHHPSRLCFDRETDTVETGAPSLPLKFTSVNCYNRSVTFQQKEKESGSKLVGSALHLIAKVKWECDNDSTDTEQLREASQHWHFLDVDTFRLQKASQWLRSDCFTVRKVFLLSAWSCHFKKPISNIRLCIGDHTDYPSFYFQHAERMMAPTCPACLTAHVYSFVSRTAGGES